MRGSLQHKTWGHLPNWTGCVHARAPLFTLEPSSLYRPRSSHPRPAVSKEPLEQIQKAATIRCTGQQPPPSSWPPLPLPSPALTCGPHYTLACPTPPPRPDLLEAP